MILGNKTSIPIDDHEFLEFISSFNEDEGYSKEIPEVFLYDLRRLDLLVGRDLLPKYKDYFQDQVKGMIFTTWHIDYDDNPLYPKLRLSNSRNNFLGAPLLNGRPVQAHSVGIGIDERTT